MNSAKHLSITVDVINAFVDGRVGGNPAGVVLEADHLSNAQKLAIAKAVGLSETAFVSSSQQASFKLEFFTPTRQIAHCGHATIAVFGYLAQTGVLKDGWYSKETIDGNRKIRIKDNKAFMEQLAPQTESIEGDREKILQSVGLTEADLLYPPTKVNTGNSFVLIGVKDADRLAKITPDLGQIYRLSERLDLIGYYVFSTETRILGRDASSRMFAPRYGIEEEAATGMAAGPLACYLHQQGRLDKSNFELEQGDYMPVPSSSVIQVELTVEDDCILSLMAGGAARVSRRETVVFDRNT